MTIITPMNSEKNGKNIPLKLLNAVYIQITIQIISIVPNLKAQLKL